MPAAVRACALVLCPLVSVAALCCMARQSGDRSTVISSDTGRDGCFVTWYSDEADSGYYLCRTGADGDTMCIFHRWIVDVRPHLRLWGPYKSPNMDFTADENWRVFRHHRLEVLKAGQDYSAYEDICTSVASVDSTSVTATPEQIRWETFWRFEDDNTDDAMNIRRVLGMSRENEYVTVTYHFTWDSPDDSVRFSFRDRPRIQPDGSTHDVGYAPGYGEVRRDMRFAAEDLGYWLGMAGVGNPLAKADTLYDGSASYETDYLTVDYGSGTRRFPVGFMCFNTTRDIYPAEIAWVDSEFLYIPSLNADSARINTDTTSVYHSRQRWVYWRTRFVHFREGETLTLEYAVGRASHDDGKYTFPEVVFQNGTRSRCPP